MSGLPIRLRLTLWYCAMFAAAAGMLSLSSYWMLRRSLVATEYHEMQERAEDVQQLLKRLGPAADQDSLQQKFLDIYQGKDDGKYLQVIDQDGHWIYRSRRLVDEGLRPTAPADLPPEGTVVEFHQGTRYVRVLTYAIHANGRAYSVQTGLALNKPMLLLSVFREQLLLLTPAVLLLAAIGGHLMSRKALAPVAAIAAEARRITDKNLEVRLPVSTIRDEISDLSATLNQMLARVEVGVRSIRDFTANAAHELRTPLALIRTEVEVALSMRRTGDEYREACEQVQLETVRMTALIDNLLMLARVDAETETVHLEPVEANELLRRVGEKWKHAMQQALLDFKVIAPTPAVFVAADADSLRRLLTILLDNAVRYTPPGGAVTLQVAPIDQQIVFTVRDTGIGIAPQHHSRIFDRFYRVDQHRGTAESGGALSGGSGLGLALARWIAEKHDTTISVESAVGQGTSFQFPLAQVAITTRRASKSDERVLS